MRTEINSITNQYRKVNEKPRKGQAELRTVLIKKNTLQGGERSRKLRTEKGRNESMFLANPNQFTKATLDGTRGNLYKTQKRIVQHSDDRE